MTTIETNSLIAEFMGGIKSEVTELWGLGNAELKPFGKLMHVWAQNHYQELDLKYNSSWNWLMPVVEKIESIDFVVSIHQASVTICNNSGKNPYFQPHSVCETKLQSTYEAVVQFIQWYNNQVI